MNKLKVLSDVAYPDLNKLMESPTLENPNPKGGPFDLSVFRRNFDLALARAIRDTGWTARDYTGEEKSDFFTCIMRLRFRRFQIQISEMLLSQFCEQVRVIFRRFRPDFRFDIKAQNQMTIRDIDDMQAQLYAGEISFKDVIDRTYRS